MSFLQVLFLMAMSCGGGLFWALSWLFDDLIPTPLARLREELLIIRTMVRVRRTSRTTVDALLAEARRQWQAGR